MTKRQIRKAAHKSIFKEGKSHSETFDTLKPKTDWPGNSLADLISGIPSKKRHESTKNIWFAYIIVLGVIVLLRLLYVFLAVQDLGDTVSPLILLPIIVLSVFVPAGGIWAALTGRRHMLPGVALFLIFGVFRGLQYSDFQFNWDSMIVFGLIAVLGILTAILWMKWKTPHSGQVEMVETENGTSKKLRYQFEDEQDSDAELLDDSF